MSSSKPSNNYPPELRERAIRMVAEVRGEYTSDWAAAQSVADKLGIGTPQTVLNWVRKAQVDAGQRPGVTSAEAAELRRLRAEVKQLRLANDILKTASARSTASRSPPSTCAVADTAMRCTVPAVGAVIAASIFIASMVATVWPTSTSLPRATATVTTARPGTARHHHRVRTGSRRAGAPNTASGATG